MNNHPAFEHLVFNEEKQIEEHEPHLLINYRNGKYGFVGYDCYEGQYVDAGKSALNGDKYIGVMSKVDKILESRPSKGNFTNYNRPNYYLITIQ